MSDTSGRTGTQQAGIDRVGLGYTLTAYGLWGVFPLYFHLLARSSAWEILAHRLLWAALSCLVAMTALRMWSTFAAAVRDRRALGGLALAAMTITVNWVVYLYAVNSGQVIEASLGYYINPLVTVMLGVLVLREKLRPWQWAAVAIGCAAVLVLTLAIGHPPVIALTLAFSFGIYGLVKKQVAGAIPALTSMTVETLVLTGPALVCMAYLAGTGRSNVTDPAHPWYPLLLAGSGVVTLVPLLLFASGAKRLPLSTIGLLQYLAPTLQLLCGVVVLGESMSAVRWAGFGIVWMALVALTIDGVRASRPV